jgi:hypothetical protein
MPSASFGYYHGRSYRLIYTDNTALDRPDAFTPFVVPNPCATGTIGCGGTQPQTLTPGAIDLPCPRPRGRREFIRAESGAGEGQLSWIRQGGRDYFLSDAAVSTSSNNGLGSWPSFLEQVARQILQTRVDGYGRNGFARP